MKVALIGYGKMGKEIESILIDRGHTVSLIIDIDNASDLDAVHLAGVDVAIEFTTPQTAFGNIMTCLEGGCSGGLWNNRMARSFRRGKRDVSFTERCVFFMRRITAWESNVFFEVNRRLAELMEHFPEYDVTVEETHHTQKKDAPSGTAITIAEGNSRKSEPKTEMGMWGDHRSGRAGGDGRAA